MKIILFTIFVLFSTCLIGQSKIDSLKHVQDSCILIDYQEKHSAFTNVKGNNTDESESAGYPKGVFIDDIQETKLTQYDSRYEIRNLNPLFENNISIIKNSESIGCLIDAEQLDYIGDSVFRLDLSRIFGKTYRVCPDEPYYSQPTVGFGTAFFIDNDKIITALHCFDDRKISDVYFVLGYVLSNIDGTISPEFDNHQVFKIKKVIRKFVEYDIVILQLDKSYNEFFPEIARNYEYSIKKPIYALGYPVGLPLKITTNASIKSKPDNLFIYTTLDTYHGNSGSPVFDKETNQIIGVLLEGGTDFVNQGNCNRSYLCASSDCLGEKVLQLSTIIDEILPDSY